MPYYHYSIKILFFVKNLTFMIETNSIININLFLIFVFLFIFIIDSDKIITQSSIIFSHIIIIHTIIIFKISLKLFYLMYNFVLYR